MENNVESIFNSLRSRVIDISHDLMNVGDADVELLVLDDTMVDLIDTIDLSDDKEVKKALMNMYLVGKAVQEIEDKVRNVSK